MVSFILPGNSASGGFDVANSCRFDSGSDAHMHITYGSAGNQKKWSWSGWIKRGIEFTGQPNLFAVGTSNNTFSRIMFNNDSNLVYYQAVSGATTCYLETDAAYRDPSAWMHILVSIDTTLSTANNRNRLWVNGTEVTSFTYRTNYDQNYDGGINDNVKHYLGGTNTGLSDNEWDGYMAEVVFQDGVAHTGAGDFGEFDEDSPTIWKPKDVSGLTFGSNGFYLDFEDSSSLGNDISGNNNDLTLSNIAAIDQSTDTCTNNFATWNPLVGSNAGGSTYYSPTLANGNLKATPGNNAQNPIAVSTIGVSSGKWYAEFVLVSETDSGNASMIGVTDNLSAFQTENTQSSSQIIYGDNGTVYNSRAGDPTDTGTTFSTGNIIGVALDLDNNYIYFSVNGTFISSGNPTSGASGTGGFALGSGTNEYFFMVGDSRDGNTSVFQGNFGGTQTFTISSGNTDGNGYGNFEYAVPSGYFSWNTKNLAEYG